MQSPFQLPRVFPLKIVTAIFERAIGLSKLHKLYINRPEEVKGVKKFLDYTISSLNISYTVTKSGENILPEKGATIVIANHPLGGVEGVIIAKELLKERSDIKILANKYLSNIAELKDIFIDVDVLSKESSSKNMQAIRLAKKHLKDGGTLLLFPAGAVSIYQNKQLKDTKWSFSLAMLIKQTKAPVVPIFVSGKNSNLFYYLGRIHPILRTIRLARELSNKSSQKISLTASSPIPYQEVKSIKGTDNLLNYYRLSTYILKYYSEKKSNTPNNIKNKIQHIGDELALIQSGLIIEHDHYQVYCSDSKSIPKVMNEIGRMREEAFQQVGEGTGKDIDIDTYDKYYSQLFIWDTKNKELVGSYRIGHVTKIYSNYGIEGLYSNSLFNYDKRFIDSIEHSLELGRSVINPKYQKDMQPLLLLWKGIAHYVASHPEITHLFGSVSISPLYSKVSQRLIVDTLTTNHYNNKIASLVSAKTPPQLSIMSEWDDTNILESVTTPQLLSRLIQRIEGNKGLPVLLRQYLNLNGKIISFNVDHSFNDTLDGLILINLLDVNFRTLGRYMGKEKAKKYLNYHGVNHEF